MDFNKIIFYNHYHNGDIHVSRSFVNNISKKIKLISNIDIFYSHKNSDYLLKDLDIKYLPNYIQNFKSINRDMLLDKTLSINTWYGSFNKMYLKEHFITFDCLYFLFDDICKDRFGFSLSDLGHPKIFLPQIDYSYFDTKNIDKFFNNFKNTKKILIANCKCMSAQCKYFDMIPIVKKLSKIYPDYIFLVTNPEENRNIGNCKNVFMTPNIIQKSNGCDLNENSYISTFCDVIIGRASGPYTFSIVSDNLYRDAIFLCFYNKNINLVKKNWFGTSLKKELSIKAKINDYAVSINDIEMTINNVLKLL